MTNDPLVLVDTDVLIDVGRDIREAVASLQQVEQLAIPAVSVITQMELMIGCRNKAELHAMEHFLMRFQVIKLDEAISDVGVDLLRRYRLSHGLLIADALIAATALSLNHSLVTKNQRDYRFIAELDLLAYPHPFAA
jgi:predicted nucleic acid-binding protein